MRCELVLDGQVATCGDDLALVLSHTHGPEAEAIHSLAWELFQATTALAKDLGLYGAGQDILSDAFSGNLRGLIATRPGHCGPPAPGRIRLWRQG